MIRTRIRLMGAMATALVATPLLCVASPALGDSDGITNSDRRVLAMVGSDTTYFVMDAIATAYNSSKGNTTSAGADRAVNVAPILSVPAAFEVTEALSANVATKGYLKAQRLGWPAGTLVPGDADCKNARLYGGEGATDNDNNATIGSGDTYYTTVNNVELNGNSEWGDAANEKIELGVVPPNGSSSGRSFAKDTTKNPVGCVDIVRSSSAPSAGDQPTYDTWAFALDAVGWLYNKSNTHKVKSLRKSDLAKIYTCNAAGANAGKPVFATWGDVSGDATDTTPIRAYRIQAGSGTGKDVASLLIGLSDNLDANYANCPSGADFPFPTVQEHDCTNVADVDLPHAICLYGYSRWRLQQVGIEVDKRNGFLFGKYAASDDATPKLPTPSTINESASRYGATRLVYNLVYKGIVSAGVVTTANPSFDDAISMVGVTTGGVKGYVCSGRATRIIRLYGLVPLALGTTDQSVSSYGNSYCRHNKYAL